MPLRALAALEADRRVEIFAPAELTPEWVSFGKRAAGCVLATMDEPLDALTYAVLAGLRNRVIMAIDARHAADSEQLMQAGAFACVAMPFAKADVTALIASLLPAAAGPQVARPLRLALDPLTRTIRHGERTVKLTQREFALLHCLLSHEKPVSADELLRTAWGDNPKVAGSRSVLDVYVHQLRRKLARVGLDGVVQTVRGFGYELLAPSVV